MPSLLLGLLRTVQDPSKPLGSFEPLGIPYYDLLEDNILCRKMLVLNLHVFQYLTNILAYITSRNKIKDSLTIYTDRAVKKYIKLLLQMLRKLN